MWMVLSMLCCLPTDAPLCTTARAPKSDEHTLSLAGSPMPGDAPVTSTPKDDVAGAPLQSSEPLSSMVVARLGQTDVTHGLLATLDSVNKVAGKAFKAEVPQSKRPSDEGSESDIETFTDTDSGESLQSGYSGHSRTSDRLFASELAFGTIPLASTQSDPATATDTDIQHTESEAMGDTSIEAVKPDVEVLRDPAAVYHEDTENHSVQLRKDAIAALLKYHSDKGDVQTCATVLCALKGSPVFPEEARPRQHLLWTFGYIGESFHDIGGWTVVFIQSIRFVCESQSCCIVCSCGTRLLHLLLGVTSPVSTT